MKQITVTDEQFVQAAKTAIGETLHNMPRPSEGAGMGAMIEWMGAAVQSSLTLGLGMRLLKRILFAEPQQTAQDAVEAAQKLLDSPELGNEREPE